jgi:YfiH family protein
MIVRHQNGLSFFQFSHLAGCAGLRHGVFTRSGGASEDPFGTLNVSHGVGDEKQTVAANRRRIGAAMGRQPMIFLRQTHGTAVLVLAAAQRRQWPVTDPPPVGDAVVTDAVGLNLVIQVADCQAVMIYDPVKHVAANIHCGWRGNIANIIGHTVSAMRRALGSRPRDLLAGIGPSLGPCCAEFVNYQAEIPAACWKYRVDRNHFDFWRLSTDQLIAAGVPKEGVESSGFCTRCRTDLFFSYRGAATTGRFAAVIGMTR